jgi:UDP-N-acetyl-D-mannosaminuronic acid transferase (WecB/TagA/CpsF family)
MVFCGINFNQKNKWILFERHNGNKIKIIIPVNAALIVEAHHSKRFFDILNSNYVTFDGTVPYLFAKLLFSVNFAKSLK